MQRKAGVLRAAQTADFVKKMVGKLAQHVKKCGERQTKNKRRRRKCVEEC